MLKYDEYYVLLRGELGMYPLKTNRHVRKLKRQYLHKVRSMPEMRSPAVADGAVWEKVTKGRAGIEWDSIVETSMEGYRRKLRIDACQ